MENSSLPELLDSANKNYYNKQASGEYSSLIADIQSMVDKMYNIPSCNFYGIDEMPNLSSYNIEYSSESFEEFKKSYNEKHSEIAGMQRKA